MSEIALTSWHNATEGGIDERQNASWPVSTNATAFTEANGVNASNLVRDNSTEFQPDTTWTSLDSLGAASQGLILIFGTFFNGCIVYILGSETNR